MHIIHSFFRFTSLGWHKVQRIFVNDDHQHSQERTPLVPPPSPQDNSLTSVFEGFEHSGAAFWLCFYHALVYYLLAIVGFSFLIGNQWRIADSVYFATVLFTTVGYGEMHPTTPKGQIFTIFLAMYGIIILGIFLGVLGEYIVDKHNQMTQKRTQSIARSVVQTMAPPVEGSSTARQDDATTDVEEDDTKETSLLKDIWDITVLEAPIVALLVLLGLTVGHFEGWTFLESLYWLVITGTTIGFGDYYPTQMATRMMCVAFLPFAVAVLGELLARIASLYMDRKRRRVEQMFLQRSLTACDIETMDTNRNGVVELGDFLGYMLVSLGKVGQADVDEICELYRKLDRDGSGVLTKKDLKSQNEKFRKAVRKSMMAQAFR